MGWMVQKKGGVGGPFATFLGSGAGGARYLLR
jgi:hypothetical protein